MFATTDSLSVPYANIVIPPSYTPLLPQAIEGWEWGLLGPLGVHLLFPKTWGCQPKTKLTVGPSSSTRLNDQLIFVRDFYASYILIIKYTKSL